MYGTREHASVAASLHGLANVLDNQGQYEQAEDAYKQVLAIEKENFGSRRTPASIMTLITLTKLLVEHRRPREALPYAKDAWEGALEHRSLLDAVQAGPAYIATLAVLGKEDDAEKVGGLVVQLLQLLPEHHPVRVSVEREVGLRP